MNVGYLVTLVWSFYSYTSILTWYRWYESDQDTVKIHLHTKIEVSRSRLWKVRPRTGQTHIYTETQTDATERITSRTRVRFYRSSICEGGLGSRNSVCPSVRLSVTRVDCDKSKWYTVDNLIPHEMAITLLLWHQQWLMGDAPFPPKSALKVTHPLRKTPTSTDFRL